MIKYIKIIYHGSSIGRKIFFPIKSIYDLFWVRIVSERFYLRHLYNLEFKHTLNLDNPKTIQEKYLWLRLNDKTILKTQCADKYLVRDFVSKRIGEDYLVPLLFHTTDSSQITPENLPDIPFIIKTNHGCGGHTTVHDKTKLNYNKLRRSLKKALKSNFYFKNREWQYKNIVPRIIIEEVLPKDDQLVLDYKFHCYNGTVNMIEVYIYEADGLKINFYTKDWKKLDICSSSTESTGITRIPKKLKSMISLAEKLSTDFKFVRVDMYNSNEKIFIGEFTFTPSMGLQGFRPVKWNLKFGEKLKL